MYLENINGPQDVKNLSIDEMNELAKEMRVAILNRLSKHGGHFGPNLGIVEATIALHYVFDSPKDKIVLDVSHQCYPHKLLTGRKEGFTDEAKFGVISGYSNPDESEHDLFKIGHTSTSISLASGLAKARDLRGDKGNVIALIGDGSLSGGEALEGLDFAGEYEGNFIIIVNDNDMSIAENHGGLYKNLKLLRDSDGMAKNNLFKAMGLDYVFVKDGNNIEFLIEAFMSVKDSEKPVVVHICTQKGKGYAIAEKNREEWHWCSPFDLATGESRAFDGGESYNSITGEYLMKKIKSDKEVAVITSATPTVMGFTKDKREEAGTQFVDVGIAEEHAVALASGMAVNGGKPVYGVYSTFMQRTFDQISQDVCINNSPVTMLVFSASIYGMRDITHLGIYDIPMISHIPNLVYLAPTNKEEYEAMLDWAIEQREFPVAIRVPGGAVVTTGEKVSVDYGKLNTYQMKCKGEKVAIIGLGNFYGIAKDTVELLKKECNIDATLINPVYITGLDKEMLESLKANHDVVITIEDGMLEGGFGEKIAAYYGDSDMKVKCYGYKKEFLDRYNPSAILEENGIVPEKIIENIKKLINC